MIHFKNLKDHLKQKKNLKDLSDTKVKLKEPTYAFDLLLLIKKSSIKGRVTSTK
jgi:hypothetical protein